MILVCHPYIKQHEIPHFQILNFPWGRMDLKHLWLLSSHRWGSSAGINCTVLLASSFPQKRPFEGQRGILLWKVLYGLRGKVLFEVYLKCSSAKLWCVYCCLWKWWVNACQDLRGILVSAGYFLRKILRSLNEVKARHGNGTCVSSAARLRSTFYCMFTAASSQNILSILLLHSWNPQLPLTFAMYVSQLLFINNEPWCWYTVGREAGLLFLNATLSIMQHSGKCSLPDREETGTCRQDPSIALPS